MVKRIGYLQRSYQDSRKMAVSPESLFSIFTIDNDVAMVFKRIFFLY